MTTPNIRECDFCCSGPLEPLHPAVCVEIINGKECVCCDECCDHDEGCRPLAERPRIVVLCGSTRFYREFQEANYRETMEGRIVLSVGFYGHASTQAHGQSVGCDDAQKIKLDELHKRKIDLADEVLVLNVGGYIGDSTKSEIDYATKLNKPIRYLEEIDRSNAGEGAL